MAPLGSLSNFTLIHRAGYSCYVRAAYCDGGKDKNDLNNWKVIVSERIEGAINLGDTGIRSLKGAGVPDGAAVQLVVELVAAGHPMLFSAEEWTYSEDSLRTGTYKVSGTVFNPKLERVVRARPPPPPPPMQLYLSDQDTLNEKQPLLLEKERRQQEDEVANGDTSILASIKACMLCN